MRIRSKGPAAMLLFIAQVTMWAAPTSAASAPRALQHLSDGQRWTTHGPTGGRIGAIAFDSSRPHMVYAASMSGGGLFRSTTDGRTWEPSNDGIPAVVDSFEALLVVSDPPQVFAGAEYGGVYRSDDQGRHWASMRTGLPELVIVLSLVMDDESGVVYAGTSFGLYRSIDRGATWNHAPGIGLPDRPWVAALAVVPGASGHLIAAMSGGVFETIDGGETFTSLNLAAFAPRSVAVDPTDPNTIYVGSHYYADQPNFWRTSDDGQTWHGVSFGATVESIALDPRRGGIYAATGGAGLQRSDDGGVSWVRVTRDSRRATHVEVVVLDPSASHNVLVGFGSKTSFLEPAGGVARSEDGGRTWALVNEGLVNTDVESVVVDPMSSQTLWAAGLDGLWETNDGGATWFIVPGMHQRIDVVAVAPSDPMRVYVSGREGIWRSVDGGLHWAGIERGLPDGLVYTLVVSASDPDRVYAGTSVDPYETWDGGQTWHRRGSGMGVGFPMVVDPRSAEVAYAITYSSPYKTVDGGRTWQKKKHGMPYTDEYDRLVMDPSDPETLYVVNFGGLYVTHDGAENWTWVGFDYLVSDVAVDPLDPATLYVEHDAEGELVSHDAGATWSPLRDQLHASLTLTVDPGGAALYAATMGRGVERFPLR